MVVLTLAERDFTDARLRTIDGNFFFAITMTFGTAEIVLGHIDLLSSDYDEHPRGVARRAP